MSLHISRDTISHMHTDAIVNTANRFPVVGSGCDEAISGTLTAMRESSSPVEFKKKAARAFAGVTEDFKKKKESLASSSCYSYSIRVFECKICIAIVRTFSYD